MKAMTIRTQVQKELDRRFPHMDYRNLVVATAIESGKKDKLTEDWLRKTMLGDVEDGFITYSQAVAVKDAYMDAINEIKNWF